MHNRWKGALRRRLRHGVLLRPLDDPLRVVDRLAVVGHQHRHPALAGQLLHLAAAASVVQEVGQRAEAIRLDRLELVAGVLQRVVGIRARMPAWPRSLERAPAAVPLHSGLRWTVDSPGSIANAPLTAPDRSRSSASFACPSGNASTSARTGTAGASAMKRSPSS